MLRTVKIILIVSVALWGFVGAFGNLIDWSGGTIVAVHSATSMTFFEGGAESWKATTSPVVIWIGALFIVSFKILSAVYCSIGAFKMWNVRAGSSNDFNDAKHFALAGCGVAVIMLFAGFIVIGESWFELWRSDLMRGMVLESAFRYGAMIMLIAIFVSLKEELH